jgi:hypothetical protein
MLCYTSLNVFVEVRDICECQKTDSFRVPYSFVCQTVGCKSCTFGNPPTQTRVFQVLHYFRKKILGLFPSFKYMYWSCWLKIVESKPPDENHALRLAASNNTWMSPSVAPSPLILCFTVTPYARKHTHTRTHTHTPGFKRVISRLKHPQCESNARRILVNKHSCNLKLKLQL